MKIRRVLRVLLVLVWLAAIATPASGADLEVAELIAGIKKAIEEAQRTAVPPYMNLPWMEGEITYVVKTEGGGGFKIFVVTAEGKYAAEAVQRVKFRLEPPTGQRWKVEGPGEIPYAKVVGFDSKANKVFVTPPGWPVYQAIAVKVRTDTTFTDYEGKNRPISAIRVGVDALLKYKAAPGADAEPELLNLKLQTPPKR